MIYNLAFFLVIKILYGDDRSGTFWIYSEQVMECIEMALSCVENDRGKRPSIGDIIDKLNQMETKDQRSSIDQVPCYTFLLLFSSL